MASTKVFPNDPYLLISLPAFRENSARRAAVKAEIPLDTTINETDPDGFAPLMGIQVDPTAAIEYTRGLVCHYSEHEQALFGQQGNSYIEGDATSRVTFALAEVSSITTPNGQPVNVSQQARAPRLEFQIRASIANTPGDVRWGGILGSPTKTFLGCAGFVGKTGGILATRWEIWGRVVSAGSVNIAPVRATVLMIIDRIGDNHTNMYGNDVTPVP